MRMEGEDETGPSRAQEEDSELITLQPLTWSKLQDFSCHPAEHVVTWLLQCWDNGASRLELMGSEARQLELLSRERSIDKAIWKETQAITLWRRYVSAVKEKYPFMEDLVCFLGVWSTMEKGMQHLRESAVLEVTYNINLDNERLFQDLDDTKCPWSMW